MLTNVMSEFKTQCLGTSLGTYLKACHCFVMLSVGCWFFCVEPVWIKACNKDIKNNTQYLRISAKIGLGYNYYLLYLPTAVFNLTDSKRQKKKQMRISQKWMNKFSLIVAKIHSIIKNRIEIGPIV